MAKKSKSKKSAKAVVQPQPKPRSELRPAAPSFWKTNMIPAFLLFLLGMGLYAGTIGYDYVLDDAIVIEKNNFVHEGFAGVGKIMSTESFTGYFNQQRDLVEGGRYRPLSIASFAIESQIFGKKVVGQNGKVTYLPNSKASHFINILLYGLTGLLLFRVLFMWFPVSEDQPWYWSIAFIATLLFVTHPIHTEVVANVKSRDEILTVLLSLAALYATWKYFLKDSLAWLAFAAGLFILALLAKENALTIIAIVPLMGWLFRKTASSKLIMATMVFAVVGLGYLFLRMSVIGYFLSSGKEITDIMNNPFYQLKGPEKFATVFYTLGQYIKLQLFPHPLTHDYYPYHIPIMSWGDWKVILAFLTNVAFGVLGLWGLMKKKKWSFGILFYFITLSIVSNIPFTVGTFMNERFVYLPSIGICLFLAWLGVEYLPKKIKGVGQYLGYGLIAIMTIGFIVKTFERTPAWTSALTLNAAAIKISKNSARANLFYGTAVFEEYKVETDTEKKYAMLDIVSKHVYKAVEINPNYYSGWTMVAGVIGEQHKRDQNLTALLDGFYKVLDHRPNISFIDQYLDFIIGRNSDSMIIRFTIKSGKMLTQKRDFNNALRMFNHGLKINPNDPKLRQAIGEMYQVAGNSAKAAEYLQ